MEPKETEGLLVLLSRSIRFATDHPFAATWIFGAAVGSVVTYKALTFNPMREREVFQSKVYELGLIPEDLRRMLTDPNAEVRWEMPGITIVVTSEKRERPKELPDIIIETPNEGES